MRYEIGLVVLVGVLATVTCSAAEYDVYLLAGQSNMDGRGAGADLKPSQRGPIEGAIIFYRNPPAASDGWQPLDVGFSIPPGYKGKIPSTKFGPEIGFALATLKAQPKTRLALIKGSKGGTSLAKDWQPGTKGQPGTQGPCYRNYLETLAAAKKALAARSDTYTIRGLLWHQGESDAGSNAEVYEKQLIEFIARIRDDVSLPKLPVVIGEVFDNGKRDAVRKAQRAVAEKVAGVAFVSADGTETWDKGTHFDAASQLLLGERFAKACRDLLDKQNR